MMNQKYLALLQEQIQLGIPNKKLFELTPTQHQKLSDLKNFYTLHKQHPKNKPFNIGRQGSSFANPNPLFVKKGMQLTETEIQIINLHLQFATIGGHNYQVVHFLDLTEHDHNTIKQFLKDYRQSTPDTPLLKNTDCFSLDFYDYLKKAIAIQHDINTQHRQHKFVIDNVPVFRTQEKGNHKISLCLLPPVRQAIFQLNHDCLFQISRADTLLNFINYYKATK